MKRKLLIEPLSGMPMLLPEIIDPAPLVEAEAQARALADDGKVDKTETEWQLYGTGAEGAQTTYKFSDGGEGGAIARYRANGTLHVEDPSGSTDAASKGYVDAAVEAEARDDAISTHNTDIDAHADIREAVADNTTLIKALQGVGGYLTAYDFGTATPSQEDLTDYALAQIGITDPLAIFNGTRVKNTYDTHVWILANTPGTDPPVFQWMDDGADTVDVPNTSIADISADADDTVVTSGTLVNLLKSLSGRTMALLARFNPFTGHKHNGADSPKVAYGDLSGTPVIPAAQVNSDWNATQGVAQILNKPAIPAAQVNSDWNATEGVAMIKNKPAIPTVDNYIEGTIDTGRTWITGEKIFRFCKSGSITASANIEHQIDLQFYMGGKDIFIVNYGGWWNPGWGDDNINPYTYHAIPGFYPYQLSNNNWVSSRIRWQSKQSYDSIIIFETKSVWDRSETNGKYQIWIDYYRKSYS